MSWHVPEGKTSVSVFKSTDNLGKPCVALIIYQNAFVETADTHDLYPGVAVDPEAARLIIEKIQAVLREIEET